MFESSWWWRQHAPLKHRWPSTGLSSTAQHPRWQPSSQSSPWEPLNPFRSFSFQFIISHLIFLRFILTLSFRIYLGFVNVTPPPPSQILKLILPPACHIIMDDIYELQNYWSLIVAHTNTFTGAWPDRRHLRLVAARVFSRGDLLWGSKRLLNTGTAPLISRQSARIHCAALGGRCVGSEGDPTKS